MMMEKVGAVIEARADHGSKGVTVCQHAQRPEYDRDVAADRPSIEIFQVRPEPVGEILALFGGAPKPAYLRFSGHTWLDAVTIPVVIVDRPEQLVFGGATEWMRARSDDAHVAAQDVQQLRQLV